MSSASSELRSRDANRQDSRSESRLSPVEVFAASMAKELAPVLAILNQYPDTKQLTKSEKREAVKKCLNWINGKLETQGRHPEIQRTLLPLKSVCDEFLSSTTAKSKNLKSL